MSWRANVQKTCACSAVNESAEETEAVAGAQASVSTQTDNQDLICSVCGAVEVLVSFRQGRIGLHVRVRRTMDAYVMD